MEINHPGLFRMNCVSQGTIIFCLQQRTPLKSNTQRKRKRAARRGSCSKQEWSEERGTLDGEVPYYYPLARLHVISRRIHRQRMAVPEITSEKNKTTVFLTSNFMSGDETETALSFIMIKIAVFAKIFPLVGRNEWTSCVSICCLCLLVFVFIVKPEHPQGLRNRHPQC